MLNEKMDEVVLVKGWKKGANWSFPRGKIDQNESDLNCAVREALEETGFDLKAASLVGEEKDMKYLQVHIRGQDMKMYVFRGVPADTHFEPQTRKEISKVQWHRLAELPTIKVKKQQQQQQGHGEELAINANKYYMVAPFLGPLKKWINQQRRRDRASSTTLANPLPPVNEATLEQDIADDHLRDERVEEDHLARLLHTLQQSSQARTVDLPEVSSSSVKQDKEQTIAAPKSADLLALLRQGSEGRPGNKPQTPFNQVIEEPQLPSSPSHHGPSQRLSSLPPPPHFSVPSQHHQQAVQLPTAHTPNTLDLTHRPEIPPTMSGSMFAPEPAAQQQPSLAETRPGSHFAQQPPFAQQLPHFQSRQGAQSFPKPFQGVAPPPNKLPPPKLTAQSSALLNLFKGNISSELKSSNDTTRNPQELGSTASSQRNTMTAMNLMPPQVQRPLSEKVGGSAKPASTHQANLLNILRAPSTSGADSQDLNVPSPAIELSASPAPVHSKGRLPNGPPPHMEKAAAANSNGQPQRQQKPKRSNPPVSATVNGPLNTPQFDMIRSSSRDAHDNSQKSVNGPLKATPIRILSRPSSSHGPPVTPSAPKNVQLPLENSQDSHQLQVQTQSIRQPQQQPPTPDLKAHHAPPKPFQPHVLRRPDMSQGSNEPSPIQPLPSPKHRTLLSRNAAQPNDHKKSLLSLFTKPSPAISPPGNTPIEPTTIISPIEKSATPSLPQIHNRPGDVFTSTSTDTTNSASANVSGEAALQSKKFYAPDRMPPTPKAELRGGQTPRLSNANTMKPKQNSRALSRSSVASPDQKEFLLGYLADVVKSGR